MDDGTLVTGDVWLVGDDGVVVRHQQVNMPGCCGQPAVLRDVIRVDIVGDPLFKRRICDAQSLFATPQPIKIVRVVNQGKTFDSTPDDEGYLTIQMNDAGAADTILRVRTTSAGILIETVGNVIGG